MGHCEHCKQQKESVILNYFYKQTNNFAQAFRKTVCTECQSVLTDQFKFKLSN